MIRKDNGSNNSLFLSCQMGLSDGAFFMIKHTPLRNGNHPISSPVCPMGVADTLEHGLLHTRFYPMVRYDAMVCDIGIAFVCCVVSRGKSKENYIFYLFCRFLNSNYFFKFLFVLDLRNLQEQVLKAFCFKNCPAGIAAVLA